MGLSLARREARKIQIFYQFPKILGCLKELEILTDECVHHEVAQFVLSDLGPNMLSYLLVVPGVAHFNNNTGSAFVQKVLKEE